MEEHFAVLSQRPLFTGINVAESIEKLKKEGSLDTKDYSPTLTTITSSTIATLPLWG